MLTEERKLGLMGLATLGITERVQLNRTESAICGVLKLCGIEEQSAESWASELIYNEGDQPLEAVERLLKQLDLEVGE
jgi:hypothetical protein